MLEVDDEVEESTLRVEDVLGTAVVLDEPPDDAVDDGRSGPLDFPGTQVVVVDRTVDEVVGTDVVDPEPAGTAVDDVAFLTVVRVVATDVVDVASSPLCVTDAWAAGWPTPAKPTPSTSTAAARTEPFANRRAMRTIAPVPGLGPPQAVRGSV